MARSEEELAEDFECPLGSRLSSRNIWRSLSAFEIGLPLKVRRLLRDRILLQGVSWEAAAWDGFCEELRSLFALNEPKQEAVAHFAFNPEGELHGAGDVETNQRVVFDDQVIHLGSIHSVKGRSVDAMMVVETEVFRGMAADQRTMDLTTVLPHAFGVEERKFATRPVDVTAATNVFVGITRPRQFLALAMRRSPASAELIEAANAQQWEVQELKGTP